MSEALGPSFCEQRFRWRCSVQVENISAECLSYAGLLFLVVGVMAFEEAFEADNECTTETCVGDLFVFLLLCSHSFEAFNALQKKTEKTDMEETATELDGEEGSGG